uniref:Uncharacterized protein n=1 Tax=Glossina palpalis gambiensis TaxID=67801 RepID=A0A1B0AYJ4_9MUSC
MHIKRKQYENVKHVLVGAVIYIVKGLLVGLAPKWHFSLAFSYLYIRRLCPGNRRLTSSKANVTF